MHLHMLTFLPLLPFLSGVHLEAPVVLMIESEPHPCRPGRPAARMQREFGCSSGAFSKQAPAVAATRRCKRPLHLKVGRHLVVGHHAEQLLGAILPLLLVPAHEPRKALSHDALFRAHIMVIGGRCNLRSETENCHEWIPEMFAACLLGEPGYCR